MCEFSKPSQKHFPPPPLSVSVSSSGSILQTYLVVCDLAFLPSIVTVLRKSQAAGRSTGDCFGTWGWHFVFYLGPNHTYATTHMDGAHVVGRGLNHSFIFYIRLLT